MRAHVTKFLAELDLGESDVLEWAAAQVRRGGGSGVPFSEPASFSDKAFRSGVFLLEVLRAVAPHTSALELWPCIVARTDAIYQVAESVPNPNPNPNLT